MTWSDVAVGSYIYEYADFGGLLVMAKHPGIVNAPTGGCLRMRACVCVFVCVCVHAPA